MTIAHILKTITCIVLVKYQADPLKNNYILVIGLLKNLDFPHLIEQPTDNQDDCYFRIKLFSIQLNQYVS